MNKITIVSIVIIIFFAAGIFYWVRVQPEPILTESTPKDHKNTSYLINGTRITLTDGYNEFENAPGSASKTITRYFGNEVHHDLNNDGREDIVFLLTQTSGGSGTFYYVVAALNTPTGYVGSQALLLGDRIAPQTTEISQDPNHINVLVINYADRNPGESFAIPPSLGKSIWLKLDTTTMQFGEVVQNFEGEADPTKMTLTMHTWNWIRTQYNNDTTVTPRTDKKFTLTLKKNGIFSASTDCNGIGGNYTVSTNKITLSNMISTLMYCENSQEDDFKKMLSQIQNYHFTSKGELIFDLVMDSGIMVFR